jgi:integrase
MTRLRRSDPLAPAWLKNIYGAVRVYTRAHLAPCAATSLDFTSCACPKWIYAKPRDGKARRFAAQTPSFAEALEAAAQVLKGFDPEIAAARAEKTKVESGITIEAALAEYIEVLKTRRLSADYIEKQIPALFQRRRIHKTGKRSNHLSFFDFLDQYNQTAVEAIARVDQVSSALLDKWASHWKGEDTSAAYYRRLAMSFFRFAHERGMMPKLPVFSARRRHAVKPGNRCGYFPPEQYEKIVAAVAFYQTERGFMPKNFAARLLAFIELGRWSGMAIADLILFSPRENLVGDVITYRRRKSSMIAGPIVIPAALAARLRQVPAEDGSLEEMPFRMRGMNEVRNRGLWRLRFQKLCEFAGIGEVKTEIGTFRNPHPHMLRDTFAIDAILRGVSLDNVAKMLGHATVDMTQKAYLFWMKQREIYCEQQQRAALTGMESGAPDRSVASSEPRRSGRSFVQ